MRRSHAYLAFARIRDKPLFSSRFLSLFHRLSNLQALRLVEFLDVGLCGYGYIYMGRSGRKGTNVARARAVRVERP